MNIDPGSAAVVVGVATVAGKLFYDIRALRNDVRRVRVEETKAVVEDQKAETDESRVVIEAVKVYAATAENYMKKYDDLLAWKETHQEQFMELRSKVKELEAALEATKDAYNQEREAHRRTEEGMVECHRRETALMQQMHEKDLSLKELHKSYDAVLIMMAAATQGDPGDAVTRVAVEQMKEYVRYEAEMRDKRERT